MKKIMIGWILWIALIACGKKDSATGSASSYINIGDVSRTRDSTDDTLRFLVSLSPASPSAVTVQYATVDGTATAGTDFVAESGTLRFGPGQSQAYVDVPVKGRKLPQGSQEFYVQLSHSVNASLQKEKATATLKNPGYQYRLIWDEEFDDSTINTADWNFETGNSNGWGNHEQEYYTGRQENAYISNGNLVIEARKESYSGYDYTSARMTTKGKKEFMFGRIEIRAKLPVTNGIWPALWLLGSDIGQVGWPSCGEIDMMELIGKYPGRVYGTAHWNNASGQHASKGGYYDLPAGDYSQDYHVYRTDWDQDSIRWYVDDHLYETVNRKDVGDPYPFNSKFFLIFNVAVGGDWPGNPDSSSSFPQRMYVDYIKVYEK